MTALGVKQFILSKYLISERNKMILLATIFRLIDGLPLSASTDVVQRMDVKECQKYVKLISKKLYQIPDKSSLQLKGFQIQ